MNVDAQQSRLTEFLWEATHSSNELEEIRHITHFKDPSHARRFTTQILLTRCKPFNLSLLYTKLTEQMKQYVNSDFTITTLTLRDEATPRLLISWHTDVFQAISARKRKEPSAPDPPHKRAKDACLECQTELLAQRSTPLPEAAPLYAHALDEKGEWKLPPQLDTHLQALKLPLDTHSDLCQTLKRLQVLTGLLTPLDLQLEVTFQKPRLHVTISNFGSIDLLLWKSLEADLARQDAYADFAFAFKRPSLLVLSLRHKNPIFKD